MTRKRRSYKRHRWTDEELNLVCYLRYIRQWHFSQIQKANFPLLSRHALGGVYGRLPLEERTRRAITTAPVIGKSRNTTGRNPQLQAQPAFSNPEQGPSHLNSTNTEIGHAPLTSNGNNSNRYNLRPNRPTTFTERKPRYMVDRARFPHFFESYSNHLKSYELQDSEYLPPSHTPTPSSSEYSHSVNSSQPSETSSLELFGLEARSPEIPDYTPSVHSIRSSDTSNTEFFSTEES
ncbi:hypothetical protein N7489_004955 [Penicillium chrysogenum]|uniref:Clr5 domain-containing protein n=1 Tax=Penicillium chrysogenum TaxID=5076 RepID=A0ABQ8WDG1_PENCH|nr:uncharacterized protein N7489_004955 [Penicillium chrysogenum]KAJ5244859.1 hypothetical protein N7489_004955 [Penicillium chrysogenum]KAJ5264663.1 hypothetical protein N7505_007456 [Penicillium chrysogenum]